MTQDGERIQRAVRAHYASRAEASALPSRGTSDPGCCAAEALYPARDLADLPEAARASLGCGDPVSLAKLRQGETVLDLGSGGGLDCFLAAREVGPDGRVIGIDMTPEMIARANANRAAVGFDNVEFRQGQIEDLPVDDESVDVVLSNCVINLAPDKEAVFGEVFRVLKRGGRIAISDMVTDGPFDAAIRADLDRWAECVAGALEADEYTALIREAGFVEVEIVGQARGPLTVPQQDGMPNVFSAKVTGRKPQ